MNSLDSLSRKSIMAALLCITQYLTFPDESVVYVFGKTI